MAADDKYQDSDSDSKPPVDDADMQFIDRDDDSGFEFVDRDLDDDHPGASDSDAEPDPGYAAFASELDDPLADWPSPDSSLEDLPEVRMQERTAAPLHEETAAASDDSDPLTFDTFGGAAADREPETPSAPEELAFHDDDHTEPAGPDQVDADSPPHEELVENERSSPPDDEDVAADPFADLPEPPAALEADDLPDPPMASDGPSEPEPAQVEGFGRFPEPPREVPSGDDLVDDFLNDLDPPEDKPGDALEDFPGMSVGAGVETASDNSFPPSYEEAAEETTADGHDSYGAPQTTAETRSTDTETDLMSSERPSRSKAGKKSASSKEERSIPLGMIAIVVLALVLLGVGSYGVIKQRSGLEEEIRDLRAQLATTVAPEVADAERERQRQVELLNESLTAEVEALAAENADLANQLQSLESTLAEQAAKAEAEAQAASERIAAAQRDARQAESTPPPAAAATEPTIAEGTWFVNFGSYAQKIVADRWANELQVGDGQVVVQTATAAGKSLYRVRVVGLKDQDEAERIATALERQYQLPRLWVGKN